MNAHLRNGGQCVYCAFRSKRLALQSLRLRRGSTKKFSQSTSHLLQSSARFQSEYRSVSYAPKRDGNLVRKHGGPQGEPVKGAGGAFGIRAGRGTMFLKRDFESVLEVRLQVIKEELRKTPLVEGLRKEKIQAGQKPRSFDEIWVEFAGSLQRGTKLESVPFLGPVKDSAHEELLTSLQPAFERRGQSGLDERLRYAFYSRLIRPRFTASDISNQRTLADLRYPSEWYPATRKQPRTVHLHVGPTNSGKTYHALQRLEQAETGVYAGPLRLLAHEVYTRMNAKGKSCSLVTGEERRMADAEAKDYGKISACTVEMMPLNRVMDVAVIDEIQMIGNAERGWAWTQAFLGVRAKEVHVCGEERTVPLVQEICASLGEKLHIHRYQRLSPLKMDSQSLNGRLKDLRKGDCIVSFSVMGIHALRQQIEKQTGKKVATVYGSLPPETRAQQARLFNDPDNEYDYLVASDAVGMGLNLAIKRIIFEASNKFDGHQRRTLNIADIKQIAGRAGRYKIASFKQSEEEAQAAENLAAAKGEEVPPIADGSTNSEEPTTEPPSLSTTEDVTTGLVTTLENFDYPIVRAAMSASPDPIRSAGLFPPGPILERFAAYFPPFTPFSYILTRLHELSQVHPRFHLCAFQDQLWVADLIEPVNGLTVTDRNVITSIPASTSDKELWVKLMPAYAKCIADQVGSAIFDIEELPLEVLEAEVSASRGYLRQLEQLHKGVVAYLWLSYRFAGIFYTRSAAFHVKSMVEEKIEEVLNKFSFTESQRRALAAQREKQMLMEAEAAALAEHGEEAAKADGGGEKDDTRAAELDLHEQTTMTSGGDHVGGEEEISFQEPMGDEGAEGEISTSGILTRQHEHDAEPVDETQDADAAELFSTIVAESEAEALQTASKHELPIPTGDQISVEDAMPEAIEPESMKEDDKPLNPEQDSSRIEASFTHEAELASDSPPLVETQQVPPAPEKPRVPGEELRTSTQETGPGEKPAGFKQFGAGVPPKHLAHLDVDAKQAEQDWASRP